MRAMNKLKSSIYNADYLSLREWLVCGRKELNLTQRQLAKRLGVVRSLIGRVELGERRLDVIEFINYCKAIERCPQSFFEEMEKCNDQIKKNHL